MGVVYRLLGVIARWSEQGSRFRINLIPLNWVAMIVLGMVFAYSLGETRTSLANDRTPRETTLAELVDHQAFVHNYVTVTAPMLPRVLEQTSGESDKVTRHWGLLFDETLGRGLLAEFADDSIQATEEPVLFHLSGLVEPASPEVRDQIVQQDPNGMVDRDYVLKVDARPASPLLCLAGLAISGLLLGACLCVWLKRYILFRVIPAPEPGFEAAEPRLPEAGIDLHATGFFVLDEHTGRRFLDVPVGLVELETGEVAFLANVDASNRFMGLTTKQVSGVWALIVERGSVVAAERGLLYLGFQPRAALRFRYRNAASGKVDTAILTVSTNAERERVIAELKRTEGFGWVF